MPMSGFSTGTVNLNEASINLRASHRLSEPNLPVKKKAAAIIAESQRSRLSFVLVEASGWLATVMGAVLAARALLISNHIDEREFTTAIFSALFHGRGKQRKIDLLGSSANEGNLSSGPQ